MFHLLALYLQLKVGLLLRAHIDRHTDKFQKISMLVLQAASADDDPACLAVRQNKSVLRLKDSMGSARAIENRADRSSFIGMHA